MSVSMSCGAVSSQNNTYFTSSLAKTDSSPCTAKVTQQMILIYTYTRFVKKIRTNTFCRSASASRTCASCGWTLSTSPSPAPTTRGCSRASPPSGRPARRRSSPQPPTASPRPSYAERTRVITVSGAEDLVLQPSICETFISFFDLGRGGPLYYARVKILPLKRWASRNRETKLSP